jgi:hypothetical protein
MTNNAARTALILLAAMMLTALYGCDDEPTLHEDFATYEPSDPVPFSPIPGADVENWVSAIERLGLGDWSTAGEPVPADYHRAEFEPREDSRIDEDRLAWVLEASVPNETVDFTFTAQAVTDPDGRVLTMTCEAAYEVPPGDQFGDAASILLEGVREVLEPCVSGFACDVLNSSDLGDRINVMMTTAETEYYADHGDGGFLVENMIDRDGVLLWCSSDQERTTVSIYLNPRSLGVTS